VTLQSDIPSNAFVPALQGHALVADSIYSAVVPQPAVSVATAGVAIASLTELLHRRSRRSPVVGWPRIAFSTPLDSWRGVTPPC